MSDLLTDEELRQLADMRSTSLSDIGHLRLIAQAQLDKLITVGWKSPEETTEQAERDRRAWDAYVKKQVEDERREIGKWLAQNPYLDALLKGERR